VLPEARAHYTAGIGNRLCKFLASRPLVVRGQPDVIERITDIPIASGESEFTRFDFRDLIELRTVDILQPDLSIAGGITEGMRIEALASAHQLRFAPHLWGGALTFAAGLHVAAVASSGFILEYSLGANPMLHQLALEDGRRHDRDPRSTGARRHRRRGVRRALSGALTRPRGGDGRFLLWDTRKQPGTAEILARVAGVAASTESACHAERMSCLPCCAPW
jgi:Enolase C-terminal domain-like